LDPRWLYGDNNLDTAIRKGARNVYLEREGFFKAEAKAQAYSKKLQTMLASPPVQTL